MKRRLKEPFGKAGLTVAILALVMALVGGAYAAGGLTKSQEKQVTKIAKKYAGKPGATGPAGPAGTNGTNGEPGKNGVSVTTSAATEVECPSGGVKLTASNGSSKVCNGTTGYTETLPSKKTEQGEWVLSQSKSLIEVSAPISFVIPLASAPTPHFILLNGKELEYNAGTETFQEVTNTKCLGTESAPQAKPGELCLYTKFEFSVGKVRITPVDTFGAVVLSAEGAAAGAYAQGSWAVTAP
jgi:hypothetical protein